MRKVRFIRGLSFLDSVMLGIGFIIGSGIFIMPLFTAQKAGTLSLLAWVLAGIYTIITGACFAEAAAKFPKAGGLYSYAHEAFGDLIGFLAGWTFWIGYWITIATETWAIGYYLQYFLPETSTLTRVMIAAIVAVGLSFVNYRGAKGSANLGDFFTVAKLVPIFLFIVVGLLFIRLENYFPIIPQNISPLPALGSATLLALWAYLGVEIITVPEEEIKNGKRTVPRAIFVAVFTVIVIYMLVSFVFLGLNWRAFSSSQSPLAEAFQSITGRYVGSIGGIILAVGAIVSIVGSLNAVILGAARISYAMSRDKLFPEPFGRLHPAYKTPYVGILVQVILALILTFSLTDFTQLASLAVMFTLVPYTISCLAVFKLVKNAKHEKVILRSRYTPNCSHRLCAPANTVQPISPNLGCRIRLRGDCFLPRTKAYRA